MELGVDLLRHPSVGPHYLFDAQRLTKFDGDSFTRLNDEPWTADTTPQPAAIVLP
ncbi:hypothetical protein EDD22DRAFT_786904 [Suillus occidentalis]|nr:hypothetical protein EDD22DRAFT_786904 [Suillus occidentalis]